MLVGAFQVQVGRLVQAVLRALREHAGMGDAGVEPDVEDVGDLFVAGGLVAEQFGRIQRVPGIDALVFDAVGDLLASTPACADAARRVSRSKNNAIGTPQVRWREMHQSGRPSTMPKMRASPQSGNPADLADRGERIAAQSGLLHRDEPLRRGAERHRRACGASNADSCA